MWVAQFGINACAALTKLVQYADWFVDDYLPPSKHAGAVDYESSICSTGTARCQSPLIVSDCCQIASSKPKACPSTGSSQCYCTLGSVKTVGWIVFGVAALVLLLLVLCICCCACKIVKKGKKLVSGGNNHGPAPVDSARVDVPSSAPAQHAPYVPGMYSNNFVPESYPQSKF
jgi:hypothetical protein